MPAALSPALRPLLALDDPLNDERANSTVPPAAVSCPSDRARSEGLAFVHRRCPCVRRKNPAILPARARVICGVAEAERGAGEEVPSVGDLLVPGVGSPLRDAGFEHRRRAADVTGVTRGESRVPDLRRRLGRDPGEHGLVKREVVAGWGGADPKGVTLDVRPDAGRGAWVIVDFDCGAPLAVEVGGGRRGAGDQGEGPDRQSETGAPFFLAVRSPPENLPEPVHDPGRFGAICRLAQSRRPPKVSVRRRASTPGGINPVG